jgi:hypothetical protein
MQCGLYLTRSKKLAFVFYHNSTAEYPWEGVILGEMDVKSWDTNGKLFSNPSSISEYDLIEEMNVYEKDERQIISDALVLVNNT